MKAATLAITLSMLAFLAGCSENSQLSSPDPTSSVSTGVEKTANKLWVETTLVGPRGVKYHIVGSVAFDVLYNGDGESMYSLSTWTDLNITQSGTEIQWSASSAKTVVSTTGPAGVDFISENLPFQTVGSYAPYLVWIQYRVSDNSIMVNDIKVLDAIAPILDAE